MQSVHLRYGSYDHEPGEGAVQIGSTSKLSQDGIVVSNTITWNITGMLLADTQTELMTMVQGLIDAYSLHGQDAYLVLDDGTLTPHKLTSGDSIGGVYVMAPPSFPKSEGAELGNYRSYSITLQAEYQVDGGASGETPMTYDETLTFSGGGSRWAYQETLVGPPIRQQLVQRTTFKATQTGRAVGYRSYPIIPGPYWPQFEHEDQRSVTRKLPKRSGFGPGAFESEYEVTWSYQFEFTEPFSGDPRRG